MIRAAIFDDEYIVLKGLEAMIDWNGFGLELAGSASDGISALEVFRKVRPEVIFTDIRMPGMDGLQLVEAIMQEAPDTYCIVFSGFNEFEYVKKAIQLGVADYLEKPVTIEHIEKAIRKVLDQMNRQKEMDLLKLKWETSKRELLEKSTLDLLLYGPEAVEKWRESFGPDAESVACITVFAAAKPIPVPKQLDHLAVQVRHGEEWWTAFFHQAEPTREFWELLLPTAEYAEIPVGSGRTCRQVEAASESCKEAVRALRSAHFLGEKGIVRFEDLGELITASKEMSEREESLILSLRSGNRDALLKHTDEFIQWLQTEKVEPEAAEHEMLKLVYLATEEVKKLAPQRQPEPDKPHAALREMAAKGRAAEWFRETLRRLADQTFADREETKHASIQRALDYMEEHYARDLSLQEVAEHVGMNPTYFSGLFKEEVGESYIKYVTRIRMELAKKLLAKGLKVNEVSEQTGYHTYRHFSELFKKYTGMTPGHFRQQYETPFEAPSAD